MSHFCKRRYSCGKRNNCEVECDRSTKEPIMKPSLSIIAVILIRNSLLYLAFSRFLETSSPSLNLPTYAAKFAYHNAARMNQPPLNPLRMNPPPQNPNPPNAAPIPPPEEGLPPAVFAPVLPLPPVPELKDSDPANNWQWNYSTIQAFRKVQAAKPRKEAQAQWLQTERNWKDRVGKSWKPVRVLGDRKSVV